MSRSFVAPCGGDPYLDLAASIVVKAVQDWRAYGHIAYPEVPSLYARVLYDMKFPSPHSELVAFFRSEWCRALVDNFEVSYEAMIEEMVEKWGFPCE